MSVIAVTGGTGFVGDHFITRAVAAGHTIRALTRREQQPREGVAWIRGDLYAHDALRELSEGTNCVVHIAGAISAPDREGFAKANIEGTQNVIAAAQSAGVARFIHISSLAAREPELSLYGWSKAESESAVRATELDWTIIRPPAVYGPGDRETLELFQMAARGLVVLPPHGELSTIHVHDLCDLFLACVDNPATIGALYEPEDERTGGLTHRAFGKALGRAVGTNPKTLSMPAFAMKAGARLDRLFRGKNAKLTPDRARYFCHPDWTVNAAYQPANSVWTPSIPLETGLATTAVWYRTNNWLK